MVAKLGANKLVGVDINGGMGKAKDIMAADASVPKDVIEFELGDFFAPLYLSSADSGSFDVVAGIWSLNYAGNQAMMGQVFKNIAKYLKDGGRFVSIIPSKASHGSRDSWPGLEEQNGWYGAGKKIIEEIEDGDRVRTIFLTNPPLEFDNFDLDQSVYFKAVEGAGLNDVKTDAKGKIALPFKNGEDQAYWDRYLERPLFDVITGNK